MLTPSRSTFPCLSALATALSLGSAHAQSPAPVSLPTLTFSLLQGGVSTAPVYTYQAVLSGYVFAPGTVLTPQQVNDFSIASFQESGFELQPGTSVLQAYGTTAPSANSAGDLDWAFSGDLRLAAFSVNSVPEDPLPPSDPLTFTIVVLSPNGAVPLPNVPFYYTTVSGLPKGQQIPFAAVPEPSTLALLGLGIGGLLAVARRRRSA